MGFQGREVAIVGIGNTEYSKNSGRSELQLAAECSLSALQDAGINPADVDGMITFTIDNSDETGLTRCLGVRDLAFTSRVPGGGAGSVATLQHAAAVVASGVAEIVVIWRAMNERSQYRFGQAQTASSGTTGIGASSLMSSIPYGAQTAASWAALSSKPYMEKYGVTNRDLGLVSVLQREYAAKNPDAWFYEKPITLDDHQNSRWVIPPILRLLDCCQESDGGVALVVTTMERARDLKQKPVRIVGATSSLPYNNEIITNFFRDDLLEMAEAKGAADRLYAQTGLSAADIDVAMFYDAFTPKVLMQIEAFGFCGEGEAKDLLADGFGRIDSSCPFNTNGGLIGEAYVHGMNSLIEMVRQLRGTSVNQVAEAKLAIATSGAAGAILGAD